MSSFLLTKGFRCSKRPFSNICWGDPEEEYYVPFSFLKHPLFQDLLSRAEEGPILCSVLSIYTTIVWQCIVSASLQEESLEHNNNDSDEVCSVHTSKYLFAMIRVEFLKICFERRAMWMLTFLHDQSLCHLEKKNSNSSCFKICDWFS